MYFELIFPIDLVDVGTINPPQFKIHQVSIPLLLLLNAKALVLVYFSKTLKVIILFFRFAEGDSILAPGGSISNMYALMIARHKLFPQHKKYGMRAIKGQLMMYTSQHVRKREIEGF